MKRNLKILIILLVLTFGISSVNAELEPLKKKNNLQNKLVENIVSVV